LPSDERLSQHQDRDGRDGRITETTSNLNKYFSSFVLPSITEEHSPQTSLKLKHWGGIRKGGPWSARFRLDVELPNKAISNHISAIVTIEPYGRDRQIFRI